MKFLTSIDMCNNEIRNLKLHIVPVDPVILHEALIWYNSTSHEIKYYNGYEIITLNNPQILMDLIKTLQYETSDIYVRVDAIDELLRKLREDVDSNTNRITLTEENITNIFEILDKKINVPEVYNTGGIPMFDDNGNLIDSGMSANDFEAANPFIMKSNEPQVMTSRFVLMPNNTLEDNDAASKKYVDEQIANASAEDVQMTDVLTDKEIIIADGQGKVIQGSGVFINVSTEPFVESSDTEIPTNRVVVNYVQQQLSGLTGSLIVKGSLGENGTLSALPTTYDVGHTYYVATEGEYAGQYCGVGDALVAVVKREGSGNQNSDWIRLKSNTENFTGATETTDGAQGIVPAPLAGDQGKFLRADGTWASTDVNKYRAKNPELVAENYVATWEVTHYLGTRHVIVNVSMGNSPYSVVYCDIDKTTLNMVTIKIVTTEENEVIPAGTYDVTVI